jgi:hypothetical protein
VPSATSLQECPGLISHAPAALQVAAPVQVSGSSAPVTGTQVPGQVELSQRSHIPQPAVAQQTLSTHAPESQSAALVQLPPTSTNSQTSPKYFEGSTGSEPDAPPKRTIRRRPSS